MVGQGREGASVMPALFAFSASVVVHSLGENSLHRVVLLWALVCMYVCICYIYLNNNMFKNSPQYWFLYFRKVLTFFRKQPKILRHFVRNHREYLYPVCLCWWVLGKERRPNRLPLKGLSP